MSSVATLTDDASFIAMAINQKRSLNDLFTHNNDSCDLSDQHMNDMVDGLWPLGNPDCLLGDTALVEGIYDDNAEDTDPLRDYLDICFSSDLFDDLGKPSFLLSTFDENNNQSMSPPSPSGIHQRHFGNDDQPFNDARQPETNNSTGPTTMMKRKNDPCLIDSDSHFDTGNAWRAASYLSRGLNKRQKLHRYNSLNDADDVELVSDDSWSSLGNEDRHRRPVKLTTQLHVDVNELSTIPPIKPAVNVERRGIPARDVIRDETTHQLPESFAIDPTAVALKGNRSSSDLIKTSMTSWYSRPSSLPVINPNRPSAHLTKPRKSAIMLPSDSLLPQNEPRSCNRSTVSPVIEILPTSKQHNGDVAIRQLYSRTSELSFPWTHQHDVVDSIHIDKLISSNCELSPNVSYSSNPGGLVPRSTVPSCWNESRAQQKNHPFDGTTPRSFIAPRAAAAVITSSSLDKVVSPTPISPVVILPTISCTDFHPCDPKFHASNPQYRPMTTQIPAQQAPLTIISPMPTTPSASAPLNAHLIPASTTSSSADTLPNFRQEHSCPGSKVRRLTALPLDSISPTNFDDQFSWMRHPRQVDVSSLSSPSITSSLESPNCGTPDVLQYEPTSSYLFYDQLSQRVQSSPTISSMTTDYSPSTAVSTNPRKKVRMPSASNSNNSKSKTCRLSRQSQCSNFDQTSSRHQLSRDVDEDGLATEQSSRCAADSSSTELLTPATTKTAMNGSSRKTIEALSVKIRKNLEQKHIRLSIPSTSSPTSSSQEGSTDASMGAETGSISPINSQTVASPLVDRSPRAVSPTRADRDRCRHSEADDGGEPFGCCCIFNSLDTTVGYEPSLERSSSQDEEVWEDTIKQEEVSNGSPSISSNEGLQSTVSGFRLSLDAPVSRLSQTDEDRITYLNKGQYYRLSMEYNNDDIKNDQHGPGEWMTSQTTSLPTTAATQAGLLKSVVMVQFRDPAAVGDEMEAWRMWHSRQPSFKQRILDIDYKNSAGVAFNSMEEIAYNATSIVWEAANQPVKVNIAVNCLSTDFSTQKGVKGIPLNIQVDTYNCDKSGATLLHRAVCRIKVFCEKGAERKIRDEERKKCVLAQSGVEPTNNFEYAAVGNSWFNFYTADDNLRNPVLFVPSNNMTSLATVTTPVTGKATIIPNVTQRSNGMSNGLDISLKCKAQSQSVVTKCSCGDKGRCEQSSLVKPALLLYVRKPRDFEFTPIYLYSPTINSLIAAIEDFCGINADWIRNIFRRSRKGITIKMDDQMLRHYSNESAFVISTVPSSVCVQHVTSAKACEHHCDIVYDVILSEANDVDQGMMQSR